MSLKKHSGRLTGNLWVPSEQERGLRRTVLDYSKQYHRTDKLRKVMMNQIHRNSVE